MESLLAQQEPETWNMCHEFSISCFMKLRKPTLDIFPSIQQQNRRDF